VYIYGRRDGVYVSRKRRRTRWRKGSQEIANGHDGWSWRRWLLSADGPGGGPGSGGGRRRRNGEGDHRVGVGYDGFHGWMNIVLLFVFLSFVFTEAVYDGKGVKG
jgi:hypothetical protein